MLFNVHNCVFDLHYIICLPPTRKITSPRLFLSIAQIKINHYEYIDCLTMYIVCPNTRIREIVLATQLNKTKFIRKLKNCVLTVVVSKQMLRDKRIFFILKSDIFSIFACWFLNLYLNWKKNNFNLICVFFFFCKAVHFLQK